ncbi:hypothetical protein BR93DRAFT_981111 [Coniochaeta sp. PMI_546]|nr:hypothetical protein BR93DRAFT_981111 [Coniochaeta sp. PMI_546]
MHSFRNIVGGVVLNLFLPSPAFANPLPTPIVQTVQTAQDIFKVGDEAVFTPTSGGGAAAALTAAPFYADAAAIANSPLMMTITVINKHVTQVSTYHAHEAGGPTAVKGSAGSGTMAKGATASLALPTGWAGNIAVAEYGGPRGVVGDESLIEANFKKPDGYSVAAADVDVSYVNGFSIPIVCSCEGAGATPFSKPCQGGAYTYVNDHKANGFGVCQSGRFTCCIGTACDRDPKQPN